MADIDWQSIGYANGMALCTGAMASHSYPTQDRYTPENESDYIAGYNGAIHDYQTDGFKPLAHYMVERG
jgi:hypothetical protein